MRLSFLLFSVIMGTTAWGATLIGNIGAFANGSNNVFGATATTVGFSVNAGTNYDLTAALFTLNNTNTFTIPASNLNVGLFADGGGKPAGNALVTFTVGGNIGIGDATYTATPNSPFQLDASTTYWLILNDPSDSLLFWQSTATTPTGGGASFAGSSQGNMTSPTQVGSFGPGNINAPLLFEIDGTPSVTGQTPEPGTLLLTACGVCGLMFLRRRLSRFHL